MKDKHVVLISILLLVFIYFYFHVIPLKDKENNVNIQIAYLMLGTDYQYTLMINKKQIKKGGDTQSITFFCQDRQANIPLTIEGGWLKAAIPVNICQQ